MKKLIISGFLLLAPWAAFSAELETVHEVKPGEVISADVFNEVFTQVENVSKGVTADDFLGTWNLTQTTCRGGVPGNCSGFFSGSAEGFVNDSNGLTRSRTDSVTFEKNSDGTYNYSQDSYRSLVRSHSDDGLRSGIYGVVDGFAIFLRSGESTPTGFFHVKKLSETRLFLSVLAAASNSFNLVRLDKVSLPPDGPTGLTVNVEAASAQLTWTDNASDEDEYRVVRRDSLDGLYEDISGALAADTALFTDMLSSAGTFWYRIEARNENGASVRSNVVRVTCIVSESESLECVNPDDTPD